MPLPRKLNSVDLFTGLGGFVLGLSRMYTPIVYCDASPLVRSNLIRLIASKQIPAAPIVDDVCDTAAIVSAAQGRRVDLLTAGFPCIGFSIAGKQEGLHNVESNLVRSVFDAVDKLHPSVVMLENSTGVLTTDGGANLRFIARNFERRGYDCQWTTCKASDVGLPHCRIRWFCLCVSRKHLRMPRNIKKSRAGNTNLVEGLVGPPPALGRMPPILAKRSRTYKDRVFLLGNAVVPAVVQLAFARLSQIYAWSRSLDTEALNALSRLSKIGRTGIWRSGRAMPVHPFPNQEEPDHKIVLCPDNYQPTGVRRAEITAPRIVANRHMRIWPTPRASKPSHSNVLTMRTRRDLATAALFACSVRGKAQPKAVKGQTVNPRFIEWLMGFPLGWTDVQQETPAAQV